MSQQMMRVLREQRGLLQKEVYTTLNWPQETYNNKELCKRRLTPLEKEQLGAFYGVPPEIFDEKKTLPPGNAIALPVAEQANPAMQFVNWVYSLVQDMNDLKKWREQVEKEKEEEMMKKGRKKR